VSEVLARTLPVTGRLAIMAIAIEFSLSIIIGTVSALRKGKIFDNTALVVALLFVAIPIFVACFLAQYFLAVQLGWFKPTVGAQNDWGDLWLPALVLGFSLYATSMRLMRGSVIVT
uniref:ABC transporter permease subunit n=1 Tax=Klebsiella pneumoniae TaxID=573 RepID=UPI0015E65EBA